MTIFDHLCFYIGIRVNVWVSTEEIPSIAFNFSRNSASGLNESSSHSPNFSALREVITYETNNGIQCVYSF